MNKTIFTFHILSFYLCLGQQSDSIYYHDLQIDTLIQKYQVIEKKEKIIVYRIQLAANESPDLINGIKRKYLRIFPKENVQEIFEPPYFKAITGAYLDKKNAEKKREEIKKIFKSCFIFEEKISMIDFKYDRTPTN